MSKFDNLPLNELLAQLSTLSKETQGEIISFSTSINKRNSYDLVNKSLLGKSITIEYYSTDWNDELKCIMGCIKKLSGNVTCVFSDYIVLDDNKAYSSHSLADFLIIFN